MASRARRGRDKDEVCFIDRFLFRFGTKLLLGTLIVVAVLTLAQCSIEKPESPTWNTSLTVPVVNRTYTMEELIEKMDQDDIQMQENGNITFQIEEDLDTVNLEADVLTSPDIGYAVSESLTPVTVAAPVIAPVSISLASIAGLATSLPGDSALVTARSFSVVNSMPTVSNFTEVTISSGTATVELENNLGVDLDTAIVELYDITLGRTVAVDTFPTVVASGATSSLDIDLAGERLSSRVRVIATCHTPGGTVQSFSTRYVSTELTFGSGLEVSAAVAEIPAQTVEYSQAVDLADNDLVYNASLTGGQLQFTVDNSTPLSSTISVTIPELLDGSTPVSLDTTVSGYGVVVFTRNLAGYSLVPVDSSLPQTIDIDVDVNVAGTGGAHVTIGPSDAIDVNAQLSSLQFGSVTGVFAGSEASFDDIEVDVDIPTGFDEISLVTAELTLEIVNNIEIPGSLNIQLRRPDSRTLDIVGDIDPANAQGPVTSIIVNDEIAQFLTPLPSSLEAVGSATFGDGAYEGTIEAGDWVFAKVGIEAPLEMIISESLVETDIESEEIDQEDIDQITDHFISGNFLYDITTHLPIGATMTVFLSGDSATLYTNPQVTLGPITIDAASVGTGGNVESELSLGVQELTLTNDDVQVLKNDPLFIGQELLLHGTDGQAVRVTSSDYVTIQGTVQVEYRFDGEF